MYSTPAVSPFTHPIKEHFTFLGTSWLPATTTLLEMIKILSGILAVGSGIVCAGKSLKYRSIRPLSIVAYSGVVCLVSFIGAKILQREQKNRFINIYVDFKAELEKWKQAHHAFTEALNACLDNNTDENLEELKKQNNNLKNILGFKNQGTGYHAQAVLEKFRNQLNELKPRNSVANEHLSPSPDKASCTYLLEDRLTYVSYSIQHFKQQPRAMVNAILSDPLSNLSVDGKVCDLEAEINKTIESLENFIKAW